MIQGSEMILLVDDDPSFAGDLEALLKPYHDLTWASTSTEGLRLIRTRTPTRILLDLNMPHALAALDEEEGLELVRRLTPEERERVVVVTGELSPANRERLRSLGAVRIYIKTEPLQKLRAMLQCDSLGEG